ALARCNQQVSGIDLNPERIDVAGRLSAACGQENVSFNVGSIEKLPYDDASFDGVLCTGSWMFTRPETTLREFIRVLKPEGRLYIQANGAGWSLRSIIVRGLLGGDRIEGEKSAAQMLGGRWAVIRPQARILFRTVLNRLRGRNDAPGGVFFTERYVRRLLAAA